MKPTIRKTRARKPSAAVRSVRLPLPFSFRSPESSNIAGASYNPDAQTLTVEFKAGESGPAPRRYRYDSVPLALWQEFCAEALSKGKFFANCIKPYYPATAV